MAILVASVLTVPTAYAEENNGTSPISVWDGTMPTANSSYTYGGGSGTAQDPYLLKSAYDVAMLAANVANGTDCWGTTFRLECDIDINSQAWPGIGSSTGAFKGKFDGNGHVIYNLNLASNDYAGFFGWAMTNACEIKNLGIASGEISVGSSVKAVGALVGCMDNGVVIENCFNNANITYDQLSVGGTPVGGLVGVAWRNANQIKSSYNMGDVTITNKVEGTAVKAGGMIGLCSTKNNFDSNNNNLGTLVVENCYNVGNVTNLKNGRNGDGLGSLMGENNGMQVTWTSCAAGGTITTDYFDANTADNNRVGAIGCYQWGNKTEWNNSVYNCKLILGGEEREQKLGYGNITNTEATKDEIKITSSALFANYKYQNGKAATEGEYKIRFASELTFSPYAFAKAGYIVTVSYDDNGTPKTAKDIELSGTVVYTSLKTPSGDVTPEVGKYFVAQGITDIPVEVATFTITPFVETADGVRIYGTTEIGENLSLVPAV